MQISPPRLSRLKLPLPLLSNSPIGPRSTGDPHSIALTAKLYAVYTEETKLDRFQIFLCLESDIPCLFHQGQAMTFYGTPTCQARYCDGT